MIHRAALLLALLAAVTLDGCIIHRWRVDDAPREAAPITSAVAGRFDYDVDGDVALAPLPVEEDAARVFSGSVVVHLQGDPDPVLVQFQYWQARRAPARAPAIVVTPILGGGESLAEYHCRAFAEAGMHSVLVARGTKVLRDWWSVDEVDRQLRRAVVGRRAVVDWLETRPEVDPARLGAFGISMGGILTSALVAVEPRLSSAVVALAGGDVAQIIRYSTEGRLVSWREAKEGELHETVAEVEQRLRRALPDDPVRLAPFVDPRRVLFVSTRWDTVVPPANQELLWRALGRPERYDLPSGHYTGIVFLPKVMDLAVRWLESRFVWTTMATPPLAREEDVAVRRRK
jgi:dienelactone hydrolase